MPESRLDVEYERQRRALVDKTADTVVRAWMMRDPNDRNQFIDAGMTLVDGAAQAYVTLLTGYFNAKASSIAGAVISHSVDASVFQSEVIRPEEPKFLNQAYGTYIFMLESGKDSATANEEAARYVRTLVKTHLQAVHVRVAFLWMATY